MRLLENVLALIFETITWFYPLILTTLAGFLEIFLISSLIPNINPLFLLAIFPVLYFFWLLIFLCLSTVGTSLLFLSSRKPAIIEFETLIENPILLIKYLPPLISDRLTTLVLALPCINYFYFTPTIGKWIGELRVLVMRAYSYKVNIGKNSLIVSWFLDPDLTYVGNNVVIGTECSIVAHAVNSTNGKLKYISEPIVIGNDITIGGNSRIGMGVKIEDGAIVEAGSNVLPYTRIGNGEVWGGNPAIFLRKRKEYLDVSVLTPALLQVNRTELNAIIANAIRMHPEEITDSLNSDNCAAWDSLAKLAIAASLYDRLGIRVSTEEIFELNSRQSIEQLIAFYKKDRSSSSDAESNHYNDKVPTSPELLPLYDPETVTKALAYRFQESVEEADKKIVVAASFTAQPLGSALKLWCQAFDIPFSIKFGEFNQLEQTLLSPDSDFTNNQNGVNVVLTRPEDLISDGDSDGMIRASQLLEAISRYSARQKGLIVSNLPPAVSPFFHRKRSQVDKLRVLWQEQLEKFEDIHVIDFASIVEEVGQQNAQDAAFEVIARAPYSQTVYQKLGIEIARSVCKIFLPAKKVVAIDCDGTLWGGQVGEDGIDGIALSNDYPGRSFRLFQEMLLELKKRGVLLVLASKNEEADVWNVFDSHPEMVLRRSDIAAYRINWKEKSINLCELAKELNLGLDSFVFIDDSPVERLEVETNAPQVIVVPMPENPAHYAATLSKLWCFDSSTITSEDTKRTQFMAQEQKRQKSQEGATNLESYLESLKLVVEIRLAEERDLPRVAQLTQKTNQFNLSLIRRSLPEIQDIQKSYSIFVLNLMDRFGDYGLVGVAIVKQEDENLLLDTFLMSCRALGRGAEESFLCSIFDFAHQKGLKTILAPYCSGPRNGQVKTFLLKMGFSPKQSNVLEAEVANAPERPRHVDQRNGL